METKEKSGASLCKAEETKRAEEALSLAGFDRLDSIYSRIVEASEELTDLIRLASRERGSLKAWYTLSNAKEEIEGGLLDLQKVLYGEVK